MVVPVKFGLGFMQISKWFHYWTDGICPRDLVDISPNQDFVIFVGT